MKRVRTPCLNFSSIADCAHNLRENGYLIAAAYPAGKVEPTLSLRDLPCTRPLALLFGNEHAGISAEWQKFVAPNFEAHASPMRAEECGEPPYALESE